jgi:hypothetical protein
MRIPRDDPPDGNRELSTDRAACDPHALRETSLNDMTVNDMTIEEPR